MAVAGLLMATVVVSLLYYARSVRASDTSDVEDPSVINFSVVPAPLPPDGAGTTPDRYTVRYSLSSHEDTTAERTEGSTTILLSTAPVGASTEMKATTETRATTATSTSPTSSKTSVSTSTPMTTSTKTTTTTRAPCSGGTKGWPSDMVVVSTSNGDVVGQTVPVLTKQVTTFLGVPYAVSERFRAAITPLRWAEELNVTEYGPACPQVRSSDIPAPFTLRSISERGCLNLNIYDPVCDYGETLECLEGRTVMVYLHGGGFMSGANSMHFYDGRYLAALGRVVVVVPNYRVGIFGFPSQHIPGTDRNPGLKDIIQALMWVKDNIRGFGGRPEDIVPFGQGAGAVALGIILSSANLRLQLGIRKAILSSGSSLSPPWREPLRAEWQGFLLSLKCNPDNDTALSCCLNSKSAEDLVQAQEKYPGVVGFTFPDEGVLDDVPSAVLARGLDFDGMDLFFANPMYEGDLVYYLRFPDRESAALDDVLKSALPSSISDLGRLLMQTNISTLYSLTDKRRGLGFVAVDLLGDVFHACPTLFFADRVCRGGAQAHHMVVAPQPENWGDWYRLTNQATHYDEVPFLFGLPFAADPEEADAADKDVSTKIIRIWSDFAKLGSASLTRYPSRCRHRKSITLLRNREYFDSNWRHKQCLYLNHFIRYDPSLLGSASSLVQSPMVPGAVQ